MKRARARSSISKIRWSTVERPGDVGLDLPAGVSAGALGPADYHPVDMEPAIEAPRAPVARPPRARARARRKAERV